MPCYYDDTPERNAESRRLRKIEAMLCAITSRLSAVLFADQFNEFLNLCDWNEAGVTKGEFLDWWAEHKEKDDARKEQARQEHNLAVKRRDALAKLTEEEKKILGIT